MWIASAMFDLPVPLRPSSKVRGARSRVTSLILLKFRIRIRFSTLGLCCVRRLGAAFNPKSCDYIVNADHAIDTAVSALGLVYLQAAALIAAEVYQLDADRSLDDDDPGKGDRRTSRSQHVHTHLSAKVSAMIAIRRLRRRMLIGGSASSIGPTHRPHEKQLLKLLRLHYPTCVGESSHS